jgi:hypothetical protein
MIRNQLEFEVVTRRVRYLEAQLAMVPNDEDEGSLRARARIRVELDEDRRALADYVSGVGALR